MTPPKQESRLEALGMKAMERHAATSARLAKFVACAGNLTTAFRIGHKAAIADGLAGLEKLLLEATDAQD